MVKHWFPKPKLLVQVQLFLNNYYKNKILVYLNIVFLPFLGSLIAGFGGRFLGSKGAALITIFSIGICSLFSFICFYEVAICGVSCYLKISPWITSEFFYTNWGFCFDSLTVIMVVVVTFISFLVHLYSVEYMNHDPHLPRFMAYLSLFTAFMIILVTADNFLQMFLGWEGIGLASYLLINFWFTRLQANKAAIKAMLLNRIGDFGLAIGIFLLYLSLQSLEYDSVFAVSYKLINTDFFFFFFEINLLNFIGILIFVGAIGKSAQLGLHTWLPDAMEGPTPVSALIHAATLVTAGVFLISRCSPILENCSFALSLITVFGCLTAFFAATTGLLQNDLKRVIAYSTCSQLGYMIFACGLSNYSGAIFHLANHAFFKALLFLSAGSIIHGVQDEQDMRKMGGLLRLMPFSYCMIFIGSISLMGLPFLTGYYSKDFILEIAYANYNLIGHFSYFLGILAAFFTAFYSIRLLFLTFLAEPNGFKKILNRTYESSYFLLFALGILAFPSIFIGYFLQDMIIGIGSVFWSNAIYINPKNLKLVDAEFISITIKLLPIFFSSFGAISAFFLYKYKNKYLYAFKKSYFFRKLYVFLNKKWFFDKIYNESFAQFLLVFSHRVTYKIIDRGIIEKLGPLGFSKLSLFNAKFIQSFQTGYIYHYAFFIFIGISFFILLFILKPFFFINLIDYKILGLFLISIFLMKFFK